MSSGREQAMMCVQAMRGRDAETRRALWRAALRFMQRDRGAVGEFTAPQGRVGEGAGE